MSNVSLRFQWSLSVPHAAYGVFDFNFSNGFICMTLDLFEKLSFRRYYFS